MTTTQQRPTATGHLFVRADADPGEHIDLEFGSVFVSSLHAPSTNGPNQDATAVLPFGSDAAVLVVADGVGGAPGGASASQLAVETLDSIVRNAVHDGGAHRAAVLDGIEQANRSIARTGMGATTIAVVHVEREAARPYHVGDSDVLVVGQRGRIKHQSIAHGPVGYAVEAGLLDESEAMHHEQRHLVSNVVGSPEMRIEIGPSLELAPRDTVLLATDGLWDNLFAEEIVDIVRKGPLDVAARRLIATARDRMLRPTDHGPSKPDDLTFVLYRPG